MYNTLIKKLVDLMYGTYRVKNKFEIKNPEEKVWVADASKGIITKKNENITRGTDWVTSQRAVILLTSTKIVCGKWSIPLQDIKTSQLLEIKSLMTTATVLKIETIDAINYQFGMQFNPEWLKQQVLPLTLEKASVKHSIFSVVVRVIAIGYLIFWAYKKMNV